MVGQRRTSRQATRRDSDAPSGMLAGHGDSAQREVGAVMSTPLRTIRALAPEGAG